MSPSPLWLTPANMVVVGCVCLMVPDCLNGSQAVIVYLSVMDGTAGKVWHCLIGDCMVFKQWYVPLTCMVWLAESHHALFGIQMSEAVIGNIYVSPIWCGWQSHLALFGIQMSEAVIGNMYVSLVWCGWQSHLALFGIQMSEAVIGNMYLSLVWCGWESLTMPYLAYRCLKQWLVIWMSHLYGVAGRITLPYLAYRCLKQWLAICMSHLYGMAGRVTLPYLQPVSTSNMNTLTLKVLRPPHRPIKSSLIW